MSTKKILIIVFSILSIILILAVMAFVDRNDGLIDFSKYSKTCGSAEYTFVPTTKNHVLIFDNKDIDKGKQIAWFDTQDNSALDKSIYVDYIGEDNKRSGYVDHNFPLNLKPNIEIVKNLRACFPDKKIRFGSYFTNEFRSSGYCEYKKIINSNDDFDCKKSY